jgi:hypothetical protein
MALQTPCTIEYTHAPYPTTRLTLPNVAIQHPYQRYTM